MQVSRFLRKSSAGYIFWCPACKEAHSYFTADSEKGHLYKSQWTFNGDVEKPTFTPSLLLYDIPAPGQRTTLCHLFVTDGQIIYCGDCPHEYAGKTIPLPELPEHMQADRYGDGNP